MALSASMRTALSPSSVPLIFARVFMSSMMAAIAVLKVWRLPMSSVTLAMVLWRSRRTDFWLSVSFAGSTFRSLYWTLSMTMFQRRFRKRCAPSTPEADHSRVSSAGEANIMKRRTVSAP